MTRMALLLIVAAGCATDAADPAADAAMNTSAEVKLTRTVCRGMTTTESEVAHCDVPGIGPDNPPIVMCWRYYLGRWVSQGAGEHELVAGSAFCGATFMGERWAIVVLSSSATAP